MGDSIANIDNYTVAHGGGAWTKVSAARLGGSDTSAVLTLANILPSGNITVTASADVKDATGNPLDPAQRSCEFPRSGNYPRVSSMSQTTTLHNILVSFSHDMNFILVNGNFTVTYGANTWGVVSVETYNSSTVILFLDVFTSPPVPSSASLAVTVSGAQTDTHNNPLDTYSDRNKATVTGGVYPRVDDAFILDSTHLCVDFYGLMSEDDYIGWGGVLHTDTYTIRSVPDVGGEIFYIPSAVEYYLANPSDVVKITTTNMYGSVGQTITVTVHQFARDLYGNYIDSTHRSDSFYVPGGL
jgi:hypothetical protein